MHGIAIVGGGNMGRTHAEAWSRLGLGRDIRYICTPSPGSAFPHAPMARFVTDLDEVLADPAADIVSVCTPTPSHPDLAIRALRAGKSVLLEKPIALTAAEADDVAAAAAESSGILMIAHVVRFFEGYQRVRAEAESGRLGVLRHVRATRLSAAPTWASWIADESRSGGMLVDFAIHDFDQLNLFLGRPVAVTTVPAGPLGRFETTVEYAGGGVGEVVTCAEMPPGTRFSSSLEVTGDADTASFQYPDAAHDDPFARQAAYFLGCVDERIQPEYCPTGSAVVALRVALAASDSLRAGSTVELD
ncbi:Gfo/Idh/MocA family protein [Agromyces ramosus]|uniref:Dehydrogenase n=1 Tax=Agromyces ramosus TaxID=33879 RepID=A0ABU0RAH7_9MICO|nr:Gfo/Idh/MocA family oxidoreductase [Agromyces ramosus]MDQ0895084.1 putative dehydrogenase [Agromyces ramosus]